MNSLFFILSTLGLTHVLVDSSLFKSLRKYIKLFQCHQCTGFWAGALMGFLLLEDKSLVGVIVYGFTGSYLALFSNELLLSMFDRQLNND